MVDVDAADVTESRGADVGGVDGVGREDANRRRTHQDAVAVVLEALLVVQLVDAEFLGEPFDEEVLPIEVRDTDLLAAPLRQCIEAAVRVLFALVEDGQVVLEAVRGVVAEHPDAGVGVGEDEAAEVARERLRANANRDEVEVRRQVLDLPLVEQLL